MGPTGVLLLLAGLLVLLAVLVDLLWTTLWVDGGSGPISARLASGLWRLIGPRMGGTTRSVAGPVVLTSTLALWVLLLWGGWTLVFESGDPALVPGSEKLDVDVAATMHFVAYAMFASGNAGILPASSGWQLVASVMLATGILLVTLAISYVLSVIGAVPDKRSFASSVEALGDDGVAFVLHGWNGEDFDGLGDRLSALADDLDRLTQDHLAYPILHYYHTRRDPHSSARALAVLDEALTILRFGVPEDHRPDAALITAARAAAENYIDTVEETFDLPHDEPPPTPSLQPLREAGIPTVSDEAFEQALGELAERRRKLLGVVDADVQVWPTTD